MNVLYITTWYPSRNSPSAGIFIREHAIASQKCGANIYVLHLDITKSKKIYALNVRDYVDENNIKTLVVRLESRFYKFFYISALFLFKLAYKYYLKYLQSKFIPDIIHSHVIFPAGIIGNKFSIKLKRPHIISEHWTEVNVYLRKNIFSAIGIRAYKNASYILPVSQFLKRNIHQIIAPDLNLEVIPNIVDEKLFYYSPKSHNKNRIKFVAIAHWNKSLPLHKRPDILLNALALVQNQIDQEIVLELIGGGNWIPELRNLAHQLNLEVIFSDHQPKSYIAEKLWESNFLLHASNKETFCIVIAEALKTGTPVIASNVDAIPELINNENGILSPNTVEGWTDSILTAIKIKYDHKKIAEAVKDRFNYESVGHDLVDVYSKVLSFDGNS